MATRINKFVAQATGLSRRRADALILESKVTINGQVAKPGDSVVSTDEIKFNDQLITAQANLTIMLNKPVGYVCSRSGQGNHTIYELLPSKYNSLKPIGRLDKDSSGLLLLTNDGNLALKLTHPRYSKEKVYLVTLDKPLFPGDKNQITGKGVKLSDGISRLGIETRGDTIKVTMHEGRNRQIRRTFEAIGYKVVSLHRTQIGDYLIGNLGPGQYKEVKTP